MTPPIDLRGAGQATVELLRLVAGMADRNAVPAGGADAQERLVHRDRILDSLASLLHDATQVLRGPQPVTLEEVTSEPVKALLGSLRSHPRCRVRVDVTPSDLLTRTPHHPVTAGWRRLHREILITTQDWSTNHPAPPPARWGLVADVAAIAQAVSILDFELARDARATGLPGYLVRLLRDARTSPLRLAARETLDLALHRPRADQWIPTGAPDRATVVDVDAHGLEPALAHLARVLNEGDLNLSAPDALRITRRVGKISLLIGRRLQGTPANDVSTTYTRHGEALLNAVRAAHGHIQSLTIDPDHGPAIQAHYALHAISDVMRSPDVTQIPDTVRAVTRHVGDITTGILEQFIHARATGAWITIDHKARRYRTINTRDLATTTTHLLRAHRHVAELGASQLPRPAMELGSPLAAHQQLIAARATAPIVRAEGL